MTWARVWPTAVRTASRAGRSGARHRCGGIGLVPTVNRHSRFLHDGRARSIEEAILWHGGEAAASMQRFRKLSRREREELLAFLRSL